MRVPSIVLPAKTAHTATVIFLHGLGDSGSGWEPVAQMLAPQLPHVKWILPNAYGLLLSCYIHTSNSSNRPMQRVTLNMGMQMPAWYDIKSLENRTTGEDEDGMWKTVAQVSTMIQTEISGGIPSERIILGGFSQGAAMSLLSGVSMEHKLGGLAVLSGYLPLSTKIQDVRIICIDLNYANLTRRFVDSTRKTLMHKHPSLWLTVSRMKLSSTHGANQVPRNSLIPGTPWISSRTRTWVTLDPQKSLEISCTL